MADAIGNVCLHAGTGARVRSVPAGLTSWLMNVTARAGLTPFAPYHWLMYSKSMWFDTTHATDALGWTPKWSTDEMFAQSYDWFVANRAATESAEASHHRRSTPQGALSAAKRITRIFPLVDRSAT